MAILQDPAFRWGGAASIGDGLLESPVPDAVPVTVHDKLDILAQELRALRAELTSRTLAGRLRRLGRWLRRHLWRW